jgi:hypothetical protein
MHYPTPARVAVAPGLRHDHWRPFSFEHEVVMPTYMDMHDIPGVKAADVAGAHEADVKIQ